MPELPEVETICRGIKPHICGKIFANIVIRQAQLRWRIPEDLNAQCRGRTIQNVTRRAKYILLDIVDKTIIIHLGMSGNLRITNAQTIHNKHDHVDFIFTDGTMLRFNDTRRFGAILSTSTPIKEHRLINLLGPEPLSTQFSGNHLYRLAKNRTIPIKSFIMNGHNVVGVGNIYANESLFMAGIHPNRPIGKISLNRYQKLAQSIRCILQQAIDKGGTTLRDFVNEQGKAGYFQQSLSVYGRKNEACVRCSSTIKRIVIAQRASYFCPTCQK